MELREVGTWLHKDQGNLGLVLSWRSSAAIREVRNSWERHEVAERNFPLFAADALQLTVGPPFASVEICCLAE